MKIDIEAVLYIIVTVCFFGFMTAVAFCTKDKDNNTAERIEKIEARLDALESTQGASP